MKRLNPCKPLQVGHSKQARPDSRQVRTKACPGQWSPQLHHLHVSSKEEIVHLLTMANHIQNIAKSCKIKRAWLGFKTRTVHTIAAMKLCCYIVFWCFFMIMYVPRFWSTWLVQSTMTSEQTGLHDWQQIKGVFLSLAPGMQRIATKSKKQSNTGIYN